MSSDMMLVCKEDNNYFSRSESAKRKPKEEAIFIDECSMGDPWHEFGKWFQERYCRAPGLFEQIAGKKEHDWMVLTKEDALAIKEALKTRKTHEDLDKIKLLEFLSSHIGKHISTENW